jgi:hypothetical protein
MNAPPRGKNSWSTNDCETKNWGGLRVYEFEKEVLKILDLEISGVCEISVEMMPDSLPTVTVTKYLDEEDQRKIVMLMKRYVIIEEKRDGLGKDQSTCGEVSGDDS